MLIQNNKKTTLILLLLAVVFFVLGYSGFIQATAKTATYLFHLYAEAELEKLQASGFKNERGEAEYVVSITPQELTDGKTELLRIDGVTEVRETAFSDWYVIALQAGNRRAIDAVKKAPFVEFALPNRGVWFCH